MGTAPIKFLHSFIHSFKTACPICSTVGWMGRWNYWFNTYRFRNGGKNTRLTEVIQSWLCIIFYTLYFPCREIRATLPGQGYSSRKAGATQSCKCMLGLTWTTGSLVCIRDHSYACVYTQPGVGHTDNESAHFWLRKTLGSNLRSLDLESNAPPIEPPHHPQNSHYLPHPAMLRLELIILRWAQPVMKKNKS